MRLLPRIILDGRHCRVPPANDGLAAHGLPPAHGLLRSDNLRLEPVLPSGLRVHHHSRAIVHRGWSQHADNEHSQAPPSKIYSAICCSLPEFVFFSFALPTLSSE